jgi:hypothetical protein
MGRCADAKSGAATRKPRGIAQACVRADYYYRISVRPIDKQYAVYAPDKEPPGYWEWMQKQEPAIPWDDGRARPPIRKNGDWIKAGESVFDTRGPDWRETIAWQGSGWLSLVPKPHTFAKIGLDS